MQQDPRRALVERISRCVSIGFAGSLDGYWCGAMMSMALEHWAIDIVPTW